MNTPLNNAKLQSDIDFNGYRAINNPSGGAQGTFVNVKDSPYNATGLGVADDTVAIQSAMNDVAAAGGGTVFFPKGIYLCDGVFGPSYNSILEIPFVGATSGSAIAITFLGEQPVPWSVGFSYDISRSSTIKTSRTNGTGANCSLIAASSHLGDGVIPYTSMNNIMVSIRNINFSIPDNPTMNGVYLGGCGWAFVEHCSIQGGGTEPTHGTTGLWMPNETNFGMNYANYVMVAGWDTLMKSGEHLRAPQVQLTLGKRGLVFLESIYPSWGNIQLERCVDGIVFLGYHTVDLLVEAERQGGGWWAPSHDISDASNYGTGTIRYMIGQGGGGAVTNAAALLGGTGLTLIDLYSGNISLNTSYGAGRPASKITGKGCVPAGGTTGQSLKKLSNADYDVGWV